MLSQDRKYLWQIIQASTGRRSDAFIATVQDLRDSLLSPSNEQNLDEHYVLCLADVSLEIKPQDFVSRFPIYRASTFITLDMTKLLKPDWAFDYSTENEDSKNV